MAFIPKGIPRRLTAVSTRAQFLRPLVVAGLVRRSGVLSPCVSPRHNSHMPKTSDAALSHVLCSEPDIASPWVARRLAQAHGAVSAFVRDGRVSNRPGRGRRRLAKRSWDNLLQANAAEVADELWQTLAQDPDRWSTLEAGRTRRSGAGPRGAAWATHARLRRGGTDVRSAAWRSEALMVSAESTPRS